MIKNVQVVDDVVGNLVNSLQHFKTRMNFRASNFGEDKPFQ